MRVSQEAENLQATLKFLLTSEIPGEHKRVLIEAVTDRLRSLDTEVRLQAALQRETRAWQTEENELVAMSLGGKRANSWQHADELLMNLALQLHRDPREVRVKAAELGFAAAIDFRIAKLQRAT
jgi:hypothetical protein